jgi:hypothetical protein
MEVSILSISSSMAVRSEDIPLCWVAKEAMPVPAPANPRLSRVAIVSAEIGSLFFLFQPFLYSSMNIDSPPNDRGCGAAQPL